jgi:hypothetical protein
MKIHVNYLSSRKLLTKLLATTQPRFYCWLSYLENVFTEALPSNVLSHLVPETRFRCLAMYYSVTILCTENLTSVVVYLTTLSDYKASDRRVICEDLTGRTDPAFAWKPQKPQTRQAMSWPRFETKAPTIQM